MKRYLTLVVMTLAVLALAAAALRPFPYCC